MGREFSSEILDGGQFGDDLKSSGEIELLAESAAGWGSKIPGLKVETWGIPSLIDIWATHLGRIGAC